MTTEERQYWIEAKQRIIAREKTALAGYRERLVTEPEKGSTLQSLIIRTEAKIEAESWALGKLRG